MLNVLIHFVLCIVIAIIKFCLKYTGGAEKRQTTDKYEESAQSLKIWLRTKLDLTLPASKDDFLVSHESFTHPQYVLKHHVTLYCLTPTEAVFVETPENMNIFDCEVNAFLYDAQYQHAYRIITMPMASFHQLANEIGDPEAPVILLSNSARCGGNLLLRIAETIPRVTSMGEPDGFTSALFLRLMKIFSDKDVEEILKSCIRIYCKPQYRKTKLFFIKSRGYCVQQVRQIVRCFSNVHHLYLYRESLRNIQSMERAIGSITFLRWMTELGKKPIIGWFVPKKWRFNPGGAFLSSTEGPYAWTRREEYLNELSPLGVWCILWALTNKEYLNLRKAGINIAGIKFEEFIADIHTGWDAILAHCKLSYEFDINEYADTVLATDAHEGQIFSQESLKHRKNVPLTDDIIPEVDAIADKFGLPRLRETCVLPGTIGLA